MQLAAEMLKKVKRMTLKLGTQDFRLDALIKIKIYIS